MNKTLGKYEVLEQVGAGAMGVVYRGRDRVLHREVAIKTIATADADVETKQRFYREARSCGRLSHPNIVTIFDLGEQQGVTFIGMEYLEGEDLRRFIDRKASMTLEGKVQFMAEVCDGLAHAHENRIIHRDIKPSNLFVLKSGRPKILDFGISRVSSSQLTRVGNALGTPEYMAPEQIRGKEVDARSDVFSAAVVFFELLTYAHPFAGPDLPRRIVQESPKTLRELIPMMPDRLETVLARAMSKDPAERYATAADFAKSLRKVAFEIINQCEKRIEAILARRENILRSLAALKGSGAGMPETLLNADIDLKVIDEVTPESVQKTSTNLNFFRLAELDASLSKLDGFLAGLIKDRDSTRQVLSEARNLLDSGQLTQAETILAAQPTRNAEDPAWAALREDLAKARDQQASIGSDDATLYVPRPVDATQHSLEPETIPRAIDTDAEIVKLRKKVELLFNTDLEKCLAEVEGLSPTVAVDPVIDSLYWRARDLRKTGAETGAAANPPPPPAQPAPVSSTEPTAWDVKITEQATTPVSPEKQKQWPIAKLTVTLIIGAGLVATLLAFIPGRNGETAHETVAPAALVPAPIEPVTAPEPLPVIEPVAQEKAPVPPPPAPEIPKQGAARPAPASPQVSKAVPAAPVVPEPPPVRQVEAPAARIVVKPVQPKPVDWSGDLSAAGSAFERGDYEAAISISDRILKADSQNREAQSLKDRAVAAQKLEESLSRGR